MVNISALLFPEGVTKKSLIPVLQALAIFMLARKFSVFGVVVPISIISNLVAYHFVVVEMVPPGVRLGLFHAIIEDNVGLCVTTQLAVGYKEEENCPI